MEKITAENMDYERITRWKPFLYCFVDYEEKKYKVTFTCPRCGGHNCEKLGDLDKYNFWSGHYRCTDCGETHDKGGPFCYYSDCFIKEEEKPAAVQLTLF